MAGLSDYTSEEIAAEIINRDDFPCVLLAITSIDPTRRDTVTVSASAALINRRVVNVLGQAAGQIEGSGKSLIRPS
jgi:hypothetical protein